jgi:hypothetical protein
VIHTAWWSYKHAFFLKTGYRKNKFEVFIKFRECLLPVRLESAICTDIGNFAVHFKGLNINCRVIKMCRILPLTFTKRAIVILESSNKYNSITGTHLSYCYLFLPTHCRCRGLLLHACARARAHTHTHTHTYIYTHTHGRTPLDE